MKVVALATVIAFITFFAWMGCEAVHAVKASMAIAAAKRCV